MKHITLEYARDPESGEMGFKLANATAHQGYNVASEGSLIAHDIMEHQRIEDIGSIGDELKALGGVWFVRGQHGELRRDRIGSAYNVHENVASDVVNMARYILLGWTSYKCRLTIKSNVDRCDVIEDFQDIIDYARKDIPAELEGEDRKVTSSEIDEYLSMALKYMVEGYNHAKKRYARLHPYGANNAFWAIAEAVDAGLKSAAFEGQRFRLSYSFKNARANCYGLYGDQYYY